MLLMKDRERLKLDKAFLQAKVEMCREEGREYDAKVFEHEIMNIDKQLKCKLLDNKRREKNLW